MRSDGLFSGRMQDLHAMQAQFEEAVVGGECRCSGRGSPAGKALCDPVAEALHSAEHPTVMLETFS